MVFSGRPSSACQPCRISRRKCDQIVPTCTQCIRKRIPCSGYRDLSAARWRDETSRVSRKVQRAKTRPLTALNPDSILNSHSNTRGQCAEASVVLSDSGWGNPTLPLTVLPELDLDDVALNFFMCSFICTSPFEPYLPQLYGMKHSTKAVLPAIYAAAFATFAQRTRDISLMKMAQAHYTTALLHTNKSLSSLKDAVLDETLASVLLLGLFEAVVFKGGQSPESWTAHTLGAVQLLRLRGADQFRSKTACQLFTQAITNIRTSCIQRRVPVPQEFLDLVHEASPYLDNEHPCIRIGPILDSAARMRSRAVLSSPQDVIYDALEIDQEAIALSNLTEKSMKFTTRPLKDYSKWSNLSVEHKYVSRRHAKFWNTIRMVRMFMNKAIWSRSSFALHHTSQDAPDERGSSTRYTTEELIKLRNMAAQNTIELEKDLLRSVSCFLESEDLGGQFCTSSRGLIWPLTVLSKSQIGSDWAKEYAISCLYQIGEDLNMEPAVSAARMTDEINQIEDWLHLYHL